MGGLSAADKMQLRTYKFIFNNVTHTNLLVSFLTIFLTSNVQTHSGAMRALFSLNFPKKNITDLSTLLMQVHDWVHGGLLYELCVARYNSVHINSFSQADISSLIFDIAVN